ncbi:glycoside hydrolase family 9 protein [Colwelliaceae bacterium MEBiC 14330]
MNKAVSTFREGAKNKPSTLATVIGLSLGTLIPTYTIAAEGNPRVNQVGYLPSATKVATYATNHTSPVNWQLRQGNNVVLSGQSTPKGFDSASGESIHHIDFSSAELTNTDYRLVVGNDQSYPFDINADIFTPIAYDAIKYFYHNRSGIEIKTEFTGGGLGSFANNAQWSRPAGHLNGGSGSSDFGVACWPGTCNYSLDVPYGWYDAGDHGKYVVNGGISVWKLANMYESALHLRNSASRFADGTLNIPESGNGIPDVLDEIRWQMRFMLAMQVPEGQNKAGMVHHKMHDLNWTGIPLMPHLDTQQRGLVPPTTTATLNVAATGAQCARLLSAYDADFANKCLATAERAWDAAKQNPNVLYLSNGINGTRYASGGGEYGDANIGDEFLWAAIELYITTANPKYLADIDVASVTRTTYDWQSVQVAALMSLATIPTPHTASLMAQARQKILTIADQRLATSKSEGYFAPMSASEFDWGSNNGIANMLTILGLAYDISGNDEYAQAVGSGINYLFGQNALSNSYITGHGENRSEQPHHRFWAGAKDSNFPWAPPGAFIGGPNPQLQDDLSRAAVGGCENRPQTCYLDDIGAWSTNEITINWNSVLASVLAFYDDYAHASGKAPTVNLTSPLTGDQFDSNVDVVATANAQDSDGTITAVSFYVNEVLHSVDSTAPYSATLTGLADGLYSLSAKAQDNDGNNTMSNTASFHVGEIVNIAPTASFTSAVNDLTVSVNATTSSDIDGTITSYLWDFGDGATATGVTAEHTYQAAGSYDINLTVIDDADDSSTSLESITATEPPVSQLSCTIGGLDIWNNGAIIQNVEITNISDSTLNGWSVELIANSNVGVIDAWGASLSGSGLTLTASGNNTLAPGQSLQFTGHISHDGNFNSMDCGNNDIIIDIPDDPIDDPTSEFEQLFEAESYAAMSGIQTESTTDTGGGLNIGWIDASDWIAYAAINIPQTGSYIIEYRVASNSNGGTIQFEERGGNTVYGQVSVPVTGGWQAWQTIEHTVTLTSGNHEFAIAALQGGFNINWFRIKSVQ